MYIDTQTGEIINLVQHRTNQRRAYRRNRPYQQMRRDDHFPKAMYALSLLGLLGIILSVWAQAVR
jgi:hypothetical protein